MVYYKTTFQAHLPSCWNHPFVAGMMRKCTFHCSILLFREIKPSIAIWAHIGKRLVFRLATNPYWTVSPRREAFGCCSSFNGIYTLFRADVCTSPDLFFFLRKIARPWASVFGRCKWCHSRWAAAAGDASRLPSTTCLNVAVEVLTGMWQMCFFCACTAGRCFWSFIGSGCIGKLTACVFGFQLEWFV